MEKKEDKISKLNEMHENDISDIRFCVGELNTLIEKAEVTEASVAKLEAIVSQLDSLRSKHTGSLFAWLKQNYILDD